MTRRTGGQLLVESLRAHGTDVVFGIPGNHNLPIYEHFQAAGIRHVLSRHEQGCAFAADGYARVSGKPGVAVVTAGPAVLNSLSALSQSYADSIPVLLVSPGMPIRHPSGGNGHLHEVKDQHAAVNSVVAVSHRVTSVAEIGVVVTQAFTEMTGGRPRPVHIEIPLDVLDESDEVEIGLPLFSPGVVSAPNDVARAAQVIADSTRPGIVIGGGASLAAAEVRLLAERLGAYVVTSTNGKGTLPEDHPLSLGAGAHLPAVAEWVRARDVLVVVGSDLGSADLWNGAWQINGTLVRIDIDPRQIVVNARPDIPLVGDATLTLRSLLNRLGDLTSRAVEMEAIDWPTRVRAEATDEGALWGEEISAIAGVLDRDAIVAGDSAAACYYGLRANLPLYLPRSFLYPTGSGTLGYGLPAAIGAKIAAPGQQVMAVLGDGGIMFTLPELASAAAENLPIPVVVVDNGGYGQIHRNMGLRGYEPLGVEFASPDFAAVGRALGCHGVKITSPLHLSAELAKAFVSDRPTVLHVSERGAK